VRRCAPRPVWRHGPDILVHGWNKVRLKLTTHDRGGLSEKDHDLARRIDEVTGG
jgi:4a-hydroxytetrahydrobiopterin dehydratase